MSYHKVYKIQILEDSNPLFEKISAILGCMKYLPMKNRLATFMILFLIVSEYYIHNYFIIFLFHFDYYLHLAMLWHTFHFDLCIFSKNFKLYLFIQIFFLYIKLAHLWI
jgi:hypothetical protein